ncbi:Cytokine-dependent hematopoietic cell linker-like [Homarus americanus]|uniref:Cytokine-dependent hematopoietic cell linker-like n=1 Tax=Homarus americanus TaxID=6706 RepID=A0A8J5N9T2_HOMAM|nr:Cytokine-dependent hematopoietic cell linker-like [Homarus americanus]
MVCLPDNGGLGAAIFTAPLLLVRGLGRRAAHWIVINHQRHLQKLSVRRRHRQSLSQKARPCSQPLVSRTSHDCKIRPQSEPVPCTHHSQASFSNTSPATAHLDDIPAEQEVDVHVTGIHLPVEPLIVICNHSQSTYESSYLPGERLHTLRGTCFLRVPPFNHSCSVGQYHQDDAALLPHTASADGRDAGNRQGQGIGTQQPPVGYNISPGQVHGTAAGNSKWQVGADQGSLTKKEKWPPVPIPSHHTPSSLLRQPESSEGSRLGAGRSPTPEPLLPPSGHLSSGHPSGHAEQYPGPSHQANDCYIQFDQVPKEMAPPPPPESSPQLASRVRGATQEKIRLIGGDSIELLPLYRVLIEQPYFHVISRGKSMNILENASDGMFLIRPSTRSKDPLTLCLRHGGRTYNINIRHRSDGLFALGFEKTNEMTFSSVEDIINTHRREPIKLQNGERAMLTVSPRKSEHIYVQITNSRQMELKK